MYQIQRHLGVLLAATLALSPLGVAAEDTEAGRDRTNVSGERREEPIRIQATSICSLPGAPARARKR
jgi:hypothetical protein